MIIVGDNMKNKGFTLIELLAVIVIVAVVSLIAIPLINNVIETSKKGSKESSAYGFIDAVEKQVAISLTSKSFPNIDDGVYKVSTLKNDYHVKVKGESPSDDSWVKIQNKKVVDYSLKIDEYIVEPDEKGKAKIQAKDVISEIPSGSELTNPSSPPEPPIPEEPKYEVVLTPSSGGSIDVTNIEIGASTQQEITVTPDSGYYLESITCGEGFTLSDYATGTSATGSQTITISNENIEEDSSCDIVFGHIPTTKTFNGRYYGLSFDCSNLKSFYITTASTQSACCNEWGGLSSNGACCTAPYSFTLYDGAGAVIGTYSTGAYRDCNNGGGLSRTINLGASYSSLSNYTLTTCRVVPTSYPGCGSLTGFSGYYTS